MLLSSFRWSVKNTVHSDYRSSTPADGPAHTFVLTMHAGVLSMRGAPLALLLLSSSLLAHAGISNSPSSFVRGGQQTSQVLHFNQRNLDAHTKSIEECRSEFLVQESSGLSWEDAHVRLQSVGPNVLTEPPKKSTLALILEQFQDRLVQILLVVAFVSSGLAFFEKEGHPFAEPLAIITILIINAIVGAYQTLSAEDALSALKKLQPQKACVLRASMWNNDFPASELVPGDIIYVKVGDKIPADCRVLSLRTTTFSTDECSLTGESTTCQKSPQKLEAVDLGISSKSNMIFSGTTVANGGCIAMVVNTGMRTEIGVIDAGVQKAKSDEQKTPLAKKLDAFGDQLTLLIATICATVWLINIPNFSGSMFSSKAQGAIYYAKIAVALAVAAIPEGLPAVITLCLSLGTHRMARKQVIVRQLKSVETLGCTSVICTDKTGTLTTNQMTGTVFIVLLPVHCLCFFSESFAYFPG